MEDIMANIFLCSLTIAILFGIICAIVYMLPELIDKIREAKTSWDYLKEEWSENDR